MTKEMLSVSHWAQPVLTARTLRPKRFPGSKSTWSSSANTSCPLPTISQLEGSSTRKLITCLQKNNNTESSLSRLMLFLWCCWKLIKNPKKSKLSDNPGGRNGNFKKFITSLFTSKQQHLFVCVTGRLKLVWFHSVDIYCIYLIQMRHSGVLTPD